jgi:acetone carboxylase alpha subunit
MTLPGKYRKVSFVDVPYKHDDVQVSNAFAKLDSIMHSPCEMTIKPDGKWRLDFEGASRWGWHTFNAHQVAFTSGIWVMMCQTLVPTQRINDGAYYATEFHLPKGTWCNPDDRRTGHAYAWHFLVSGWAALWRGLSSPTSAAATWRKSTPATPTPPTGCRAAASTRTARSTRSTASRLRPAVPAPAPSRTASTTPPPSGTRKATWATSRSGRWPSRCSTSGRNVKANSGGYGKYRGGCGFETLRMVWNAQDWTMFFMGNGYMNSDWGMMGGYPSATGYRFEAHKTGLKERIAKGEALPLGGDLDPSKPRLRAEHRRHRRGQARQAVHDHRRLLRQPRPVPELPARRPRLRRSHRPRTKAIENDLNQKFLLPEYAQKVYGAVFTQDAKGVYSVDEAKTQARRAEIRKERMARSVPTREWMKEERERIINKHAAVQVQHMFATSFALSEKFTQQFKDLLEPAG